MTKGDIAKKRGFDLLMSIVGLGLTWWLILFAFIAASIDTKSNGFFVQERVGQFGRVFRIIKIRTMRVVSGTPTTVTTALDARITRLGSFLRKYKIDELPQLINVFLGHMSFVGPRPDVEGFADQLRGRERIVLSVRPGITGPATLRFRNEEQILAGCTDPERYNKEVIFKEKVRLNLDYIDNYSFGADMKLIWWTVFGSKNGKAA